MQRQPLYSASPSSLSPVTSISRHIRWQVSMTLIGVVLLITLLGYSTYSVSTVLAPDRGGVFREGVAGNPRYLNPLLCSSNEVDEDICTLLYRGLTKIDKQGRVVPDLAETWSITEDKIYTFRLKPDQFWSDGQPVTAEDVLFTIGILQDPDVYLDSLAVLWRTVQMEKLDDMAVRFTLSEPYTPFLDQLAIGLLPSHIWRNVPAAVLASNPLEGVPIGNGPMRITEITAEHIRLESNPFYSGATPYISALELHFYPDHPSLFPAFVAGEIDGISTIWPSDLPAAAARADLQLFNAIEPEYVHVVFNLQNPNLPFFQEKEVRQALYYGLDRERLLQEVVSGQGVIANSILLPENWAYNPNVRTYVYNAEQARGLLDAAGWIDTNGNGVRDKNGRELEFQLTTNDDITRQILIERIALDWEQIGVRAVPTQASFQGLLSDLLEPRRFDAALISWETPGDPDPYAIWHSTQAEVGKQNYSGWRNEEADQIMQEARSIVEPEQRRDLYWRFQAIFAEEAPALLLYHPVYTYGVSNRVHNVQIGSINRPSERFDNFAEWYMVTRRVPANQVPTLAPPTPPGGP